MKNLLLFLTLTTLFFSCGKEKEMLKYTGTLYKDCAKNPAANIEISIDQDIGGGLIKKTGGELARGMTDEEGNFSISFKDDGGGVIRIETINTTNPLLLGTIVIEELNPENIDLGDLYLNNRGNAYVFIETAKNFTFADTLHIWDKKYAGPFTNSAAIDSISNFYFIKQYIYSKSDKLKYRWAINPTSDDDFQIDYFELSGCGVIDTFVINID